MAPSARWSDLPPEIVAQVADRLWPRDAARLAAVDRETHRVVGPMVDRARAAVSGKAGGTTEPRSCTGPGYYQSAWEVLFEKRYVASIEREVFPLSIRLCLDSNGLHADLWDAEGLSCHVLGIDADWRLSGGYRHRRGAIGLLGLGLDDREAAVQGLVYVFQAVLGEIEAGGSTPWFRFAAAGGFQAPSPSRRPSPAARCGTCSTPSRTDGTTPSPACTGSPCPSCESGPIAAARTCSCAGPSAPSQR